MKKIIFFMKKETVLTIATLLAVVSAFFVKPDRQYIGYIDFRTLGILFGLMVIMQGFQRTGLFDRIGKSLLQKTGKLWQLILVLVIFAVGGGAGWYFKIYRPQHQQAAAPEDDYEEEMDAYNDFEDDGPPWDEDDPEPGEEDEA